MNSTQCAQLDWCHMIVLHYVQCTSSSYNHRNINIKILINISTLGSLIRARMHCGIYSMSRSVHCMHTTHFSKPMHETVQVCSAYSAETAVSSILVHYCKHVSCRSIGGSTEEGGTHYNLQLLRSTAIITHY